MPLTVFLETARLWRVAVVDPLQALLDMPRVVVDNAAGLDWALARRADGDIAGLVHTVAARGASPLVMFDQGLAGEAGAASPIPVEMLA